MTDFTFTLLSHLYTDPRHREIFSEEFTIRTWLRTEVALATAQGDLGIISAQDAQAIADVATVDRVDRRRLWESARTVGYPILGLVREINRNLPEGSRGRVHLGATTQDIMDTGLALQLADSMRLTDQQLLAVGTALAESVQTHAQTVMAARTHAQQAVPTTLDD